MRRLLTGSEGFPLLVNAAAQAADQAPDFSRRIRARLADPGPTRRGDHGLSWTWARDR